MNEIEKKVEEIKEKWKSEKQRQGIEDFYKFYRLNQQMIYEDLYDLWHICKLEELK